MLLTKKFHKSQLFDEIFSRFFFFIIKKIVLKLPTQKQKKLYFEDQELKTKINHINMKLIESKRFIYYQSNKPNKVSVSNCESASRNNLQFSRNMVNRNYVNTYTYFNVEYKMYRKKVNTLILDSLEMSLHKKKQVD